MKFQLAIVRIVYVKIERDKMKNYKVILSKNIITKSKSYLEKLKSNTNQSGYYLKQVLDGYNISELSIIEFINCLLSTKQPQIFAEVDVCGDGRDWNQEELSILGDVGIHVPVTIFDNGVHYKPLIHQEPIKGNLLYIPGILFREYMPEWNEVVEDGKIDLEQFYQIYNRRLTPLFEYVDYISEMKGVKSLITIPGIGCGCFSGCFRGKLEENLNFVLKRLLSEGNFKNINMYYDPYSGCKNETHKIDNANYLVRPFLENHKSQLCKPEVYGIEFKDCELYSVVAWDHVSWPGNDFYVNERSTDDGVKSAATDSMWQITGIEGVYDKGVNKYIPPKEYVNWKDVVIKNKLKLEVKGISYLK